MAKFLKVWNLSSGILRCSLASVSVLGIQAMETFATGAGPGGVDLLHVPMSWCPVIGSPAQATPNIAGDTVTDAVLWRRHERPTDNIYINTAGITFRSSINNAWEVLDFPQIADPNTTLGLPGDMRGDDVNTFGAEFQAMIAACDAAYADPPLNRANIGVTAVNAGLFHDAAGTYVGVLGWGGARDQRPERTQYARYHLMAELQLLTTNTFTPEALAEFSRVLHQLNLALPILLINSLVMKLAMRWVLTIRWAQPW